jgi:hypothetical protein
MVLGMPGTGGILTTKDTKDTKFYRAREEFERQAANKRKRLQRRDAENAESRRAFSLTTDSGDERRLAVSASEFGFNPENDFEPLICANLR